MGIMGGSDRHLPIFGMGRPASMEGYSLNLQSYRWDSRQTLAGQNNADASQHRSFTPAPRMRFGAERYGRHLLVYGGHGYDRIEDRGDLFLKLNLLTLEWSRVSIRNEPTG